MALDPATGKLLGGIFSSIIGQNQLGAAAPAFAPGQSNFDALQLGGEQDFSGILQTILGSQPQSIEGLIGPPQEQGQELAPQVRAQDTGPLGTTQEFQNPVDQGVLDSLQEPAEKSGFGAFFGNLDQNLQSPSKLLGLSLLSQIDPRLAQGGLLAGGLFGQNKVF